jgi:Cu(I)/Ag(I) efflux system membrane fusion protein
MKMDFTVDKSLNLTGLKAKDAIRFLVEKQDSGGVKIVEFEDSIDTGTFSIIKNANMAWVKGKILAIDSGQSKITLQHEPVEAWNWPQMKMDFPVAGAVNLAKLKPDTEMKFLVQKLDSGGIQIINLAVGDQK